MRKKWLPLLLLTVLLCLLAGSASATRVRNVDGDIRTLEEYINDRNTIIVFAGDYIIEDSYSRNFVEGIAPSVSVLAENGIRVVVVLHSAGNVFMYNEEEVLREAETYPDITFLDADGSSPMWSWLRSKGVSGSIYFPAVFIRAADGTLLDYSTGEVADPAMTAVKAVRLISGKAIDPVYLKYTLTIRYLRVDDREELVPAKILKYRPGEEVYVPTPAVDGYTPWDTEVSGEMPAYDMDVEVYYEDTVDPYPPMPEAFAVAEKDTVAVGEPIRFRYYTKYLNNGYASGFMLYEIYECRGYDEQCVYHHVSLFPPGPEGSTAEYTVTDPTVERVRIYALYGISGYQYAIATGSCYVSVDQDNVYDPFAQIKAFVTRCYSIILGREPDAGGLQTWVDELSSGRKTASEIIDRFVNSKEFTGKNYSNGEKVDILYRAMLGRNADEGGKQNWVKKLESGQTLAHVINGFCFSNEFRGLCESYGIKAGYVTIQEDSPTAESKIKAFIQRCYRIILDREADASGLQTWYNELSSRRKAASEIIDKFVNSPEFLGKKYSNEESVEILYKAMLGRSPDAAGKANWVEKLDYGRPFAVVINGFCNSAEFRGICESYGIEPGSVKMYSTAALEEPVSRTVIEPDKQPDNGETASAAREIILVDEQAEAELDTAVMVVYYNAEKVQAFVNRCYREILDRDETEDAVGQWAEQILNGAKTPDQVIRGFLFSGEFGNREKSNEELVKILYKVYMNRDADPEGLATWTAKLDGGMTLKELADAFARTNEYRKMVQALEE